MSEARKFQMHEKLLLDVIKKQAGSIEKAVLEGVMNSIEAGATKVTIKIGAESIQIDDDGKGFKSREEIEKFFETFGQPHEASEGKKWAQFRMGRGQMFAFGKNHWITGNFEMKVDIETRLGYDLIERKTPHSGCRIIIELYKMLSERDIYSIQRELANQVKYVNIPVFVNEKQVNSDPENGKWDSESDKNAFIRLDEDSPNLTVYNMGVLVKSFDKYSFGIGGTVVSKLRLDVNFARNDIIASCPVWRAIKKTIEASAGIERVKKKKTMNDSERLNMIERLCSGELPVHEAQKMPLFVDVTGTPWSADKILRGNFPNWSYAEKGNHKGDRLIQSRRALVLNETLLRAFDCAPEQVFKKKWGKGNYADSLMADYINYTPKYLPFEKLAKEVNDNFLIIPPKEWRKGEYIWKEIIGKLQYYLLDWSKSRSNSRSIMIGDSDRKAQAWTDGATYIVFDRAFLSECDFLKNRGRVDMSSLTRIATVLSHELCHDTDSRENLHSPEFYQAFHDLCVSKSSKTPSKLATAIDKVYGYLTPGSIDMLYRHATKSGCSESKAAAAIVAEPEPEIKEPPMPPAPKPQPPKSKGPGRTAAEVTDPAEIKKIAGLYKKNGGTMSFQAIELLPELNLRVCRGMTAYRICEKFNENRGAIESATRA